MMKKKDNENNNNDDNNKNNHHNNDNDNNNNNNNCLLLSEAEIFHVTQAAKNTRNRLLGSLELIFNSIEGELFRYIIVTNVPKRNGRLKMF